MMIFDFLLLPVGCEVKMFEHDERLVVRISLDLQLVMVTLPGS